MSSDTDTEIRKKGELTGELAAQILEHIRSHQLAVGTHMRAQDLAKRFSVSRFPVAQALQLLASKSVLTHAANRGYFVTSKKLPTPESLGLEKTNNASDLYFKLAEDHLHHRIPDPVSEAYLKETYGASKAQLTGVLSRISQEGWAERRPGYGWSFSQMLTTPESLEQTYRVRLALEPAALLEPGYRLEPAAAAHCRAAEIRLLDGAIETDSADAIHERGVKFHETIVGASGNPFFLEAVRRINRIRRLLSYRSMGNRNRYRRQCEEHLQILQLLEEQKNEQASRLLQLHLEHTIVNLQSIRSILKP